ncbi:DNA gyrase/topoisomerase IV, A subunit domain-containing protein, partial [Toxoplasma gondii VEG]
MGVFHSPLSSASCFLFFLFVCVFSRCPVHGARLNLPLFSSSTSSQDPSPPDLHSFSVSSTLPRSASSHLSSLLRLPFARTAQTTRLLHRQLLSSVSSHIPCFISALPSPSSFSSPSPPSPPSLPSPSSFSNSGLCSCRRPHACSHSISDGNGYRDGTCCFAGGGLSSSLLPRFIDPSPHERAPAKKRLPPISVLLRVPPSSLTATASLPSSPPSRLPPFVRLAPLLQSSWCLSPSRASVSSLAASEGTLPRTLAKEEGERKERPAPTGSDAKDVAILDTQFVEELEKSFLCYAYSTILSRALPDVRDGLKPVHRRLIYAMQQLHLHPSGSFRKCARVVGEVLGKFHPHGDQAVYDALVRLAQTFVARHPLIEGHGNFGSVDGDPPAAMRYTECRLTRFCEDALLKNLDDKVVPFRPNFDANEREPVVFPASVPLVLIQGSSGIAVGMSTQIPPHNLHEILDATIALIRDPELPDAELLRLVPGPDFPTGGLLVNSEEIPGAYKEGRGRVLLRGRFHLEGEDDDGDTVPGRDRNAEDEAERDEADRNVRNGRKNERRLVITELPYGVNKSTVMQVIAQMISVKFLEGVTSVRDESDWRGIRVVLVLRRDADAHTILTLLLKHTNLQVYIPMHLIALEKGTKPVRFSLKSMLLSWIAFRFHTLRRLLAAEEAERKARSHLLEGLLRAVSLMDDVVKTVRESLSADEAKQKLTEPPLGFSPAQAQALLRLTLSRLTRLERRQLEEEAKAQKNRLSELASLLAHDREIYELMVEELQAHKTRHKAPRKTKVLGLRRAQQRARREEDARATTARNSQEAFAETDRHDSRRPDGREKEENPVKEKKETEENVQKKDLERGKARTDARHEEGSAGQALEETEGLGGFEEKGRDDRTSTQRKKFAGQDTWRKDGIVDRQKRLKEEGETETLVSRDVNESSTEAETDASEEDREGDSSEEDQDDARVPFGEIKNMNKEDFISNQRNVVLLSAPALVRRLPLSVYPTLRRGALGVRSLSRSLASAESPDLERNEADEAQTRGVKGKLAAVGASSLQGVWSCWTKDRLLFLSANGYVSMLPAYRVPLGSRISRGTSLPQLLFEGWKKPAALRRLGESAAAAGALAEDAANREKKREEKERTLLREAAQVAAVLAVPPPTQREKARGVRQASESSGKSRKAKFLVVVTDQGRIAKIKLKRILGRRCETKVKKLLSLVQGDSIRAAALLEEEVEPLARGRVSGAGKEIKHLRGNGSECNATDEERGARKKDREEEDEETTEKEEEE